MLVDDIVNCVCYTVASVEDVDMLFVANMLKLALVFVCVGSVSVPTSHAAVAKENVILDPCCILIKQQALKDDPTALKDSNDFGVEGDEAAKARTAVDDGHGMRKPGCDVVQCAGLRVRNFEIRRCTRAGGPIFSYQLQT